MIRISANLLISVVSFITTVFVGTGLGCAVLSGKRGGRLPRGRVSGWKRLGQDWAAKNCLATMIVMAIAYSASIETSAADPASSADKILPKVAAEFAAQYEGWWREIAQGEPPDSMAARVIFAYAIALCETNKHLERLERLLELAERMQDLDPQSDSYGNLWWTWRHGRVTDRNAVEFCAQDALVLRLRYADRIPTAALRRLDAMIKRMAEGCRRHRVPVNYTNIAILNAGNLIVLGELLDDRSLVEEGTFRLDGVLLWIWQFGTTEFVNPTYYAINLHGLALLRAFAQSERARRQAEALGRLLWTDIAVNWFVPARRLAGAHSRSYDYLRGLGGVDGFMMLHGWLPWGDTDRFELLHTALFDFPPPQHLRRLSERMPRSVRQRWGLSDAESRTHAVYPDVTLSVSHASYSVARQDLPLTVDLPGERAWPRCYFIADGRQDPYGRWRYPTGGAAGHMKALHLTPFWAAAQSNRDVLAVVVYRAADLRDPEVFNIQSHFVFRKPTDGLWLAGRRVEIPKGTPDDPSAVRVEPGDAIIARWGSAAVALRVLAAARQDASPSLIRILDDGNPFGVLRLTINHRAATASTDPYAILWVRVGSELNSDAAFESWREQYEASQAEVMIDAQRIRASAPAQIGRVLVSAEQPFGLGGRIEFSPMPTKGVLELDGREIGRPLLAACEPIRSYRGPTVDRPAQLTNGRLELSAADCLVFPGMQIMRSPEGESYVVQPKEAPRSRGMLIVPLRVEQSGRYRLTVVARTPNPQSDSLYVGLVGGGTQKPLVEWHLRANPQWQEHVFRGGSAAEPTPLDMLAGDGFLILQTREPDVSIRTIRLERSDDRTKEQPTL